MQQTVSWPALAYRQMFQNWRVRGHMRLGTWMSRVFASMQDVTVPHHAGILHLDLRDLDQQRIFLDGGVKFEPREVALVKAIVKPGDTVLDVGAHIGVYSTLLAQLVGTTGKVVAYEPQPRMLELNAKPYPQLIVRPCAVSDKAGTITFVSERSSGLSHVGVPPSGGQREQFSPNSPPEGGTPTVATVTLDEEVRELQLSKVDFLKIDVEGHEEFVIQGARHLLTSDNPPILLFEWVPFFKPRWKQGAIQTLKSMLKPGWTGIALGFDGSTHLWNDWSEAAENTNYLLVPATQSSKLDAIRVSIGI
jgi:FkbM family methyltransferase